MIVALLVMAGGNIVLAAALAFALTNAAEERARLVNAVMSRTPAEFVQLQKADAPRPERKAEPRPIQVGA